MNQPLTTDEVVQTYWTSPRRVPFKPLATKAESLIKSAPIRKRAGATLAKRAYAYSEDNGFARRIFNVQTLVGNQTPEVFYNSGIAMVSSTKTAPFSAQCFPPELALFGEFMATESELGALKSSVEHAYPRTRFTFQVAEDRMAYRLITSVKPVQVQSKSTAAAVAQALEHYVNLRNNALDPVSRRLPSETYLQLSENVWIDLVIEEASNTDMLRVAASTGAAHDAGFVGMFNYRGQWVPVFTDFADAEYSFMSKDDILVVRAKSSGYMTDRGPYDASTVTELFGMAVVGWRFTARLSMALDRDAVLYATRRMY